MADLTCSCLQGGRQPLLQVQHVRFVFTLEPNGREARCTILQCADPQVRGEARPPSCYLYDYDLQSLTFSPLRQVGVADGSQLPLKLLCYWKCEPTVTNFRLDYTFVPSTLSSHSTKHPPSLTNVTISVPVSGDVRNALSKPTGVWLDDQSKMVWTVGNLQPAEQSSE